MKCFKSCEMCGRKCFIQKIRVIKLSIGVEATSKKMMCGRCFKAIKRAQDKFIIK